MGAVPRKKRERYRDIARQIAKKLGERFDEKNWPRIWGLIEEHGDPEYLYAIVDESRRLVKFGKSKNPGQRLKALRTGNGAALRLWAYCFHFSPYTEREVHRKLSAQRVSGEWFSLSSEAQGVITEMRAAEPALGGGVDRRSRV